MHRYLEIGIGIGLLLVGCTTNPSNNESSFLSGHDLDGDGIPDQVWLDYTEGAHCCYSLHVRLSSDTTQYFYPFEMDGGYTGAVDDSNPNHFNIKDVDGDGKAEIFMEVATYNGQLSEIPEEWTRRYGVTSNYILLDYSGSEFEIINLPQTISADYYFGVDQLQFQSGLFPYESDGRFGLKDSRDSVVVYPNWSKINPLPSRLVLLEDHGRIMLVNDRGLVLSELEHVFVIDSVFSEAHPILLFDGLQGFYYLNLKGEILNSEPYEDAQIFSENLAAIFDPKADKWGYVDTNLQWIIPPFCDVAGVFENGTASVFIFNKGPFTVNRQGEILSADQ